MRVNLVIPYNSFAMKNMSNPLLSLPYEITTSKEQTDADVNIHIPWHTMKENGKKNIVAYTHVNPPDVNALLDACDKADAVTAMSLHGRQELIDYGVDEKKIHVVYCGTDLQFRKRVIGVVGSTQPNGRKRESLLLDIAWLADLSDYEFLIIGNGWEEVIQKLLSLGVNVRYVNGIEDMQPAYNSMDVLLVTGYKEGGSLPIIEAMRAGVPVISPEYGYAADFLQEYYKTPQEAWLMISDLFRNQIKNKEAVKSLTWRAYADQYRKIIESLYA